MIHILEDALIDSVKLLPFLFVTYLVMEILEHQTGSKVQNRIRTAGKFAFSLGMTVGRHTTVWILCGSIQPYAGRVITVGTLLAIYLSTSDEMLPILISSQYQWRPY